MNRFIVCLMLISLLVLPTASAEPFLQHQVDAGRTGATLDPGPGDHIHDRTIDEAFTIKLPGYRAYAAPPLILNGFVYVLTGAPGPMANANAGPAEPMPELGAFALFRVGLDTANVTELVSFEEPPTSLASDGERFFVATQAGIEAYDVAQGQAEWTWEYPAHPSGEVPDTACTPLAVSEEDVYAACTQFLGDGSSSFVSVGQRSLVVALSRSDGDQKWVWTSEQATEGPLTPSARMFAMASGYEAGRMAIAGPVVAVSFVMTSRTDYIPPTWNLVLAFDRETGEAAWSDVDTAYESAETIQTVGHWPASGLLGTPDALYIKGHTLRSFDPGNWEQLWARNMDRQVDVGQSDSASPRFPGNLLGLWGDSLLSTHGKTTHALDTTSFGETFWVQPVVTSGWEDGSGLIVADGFVYGTNYVNELIVLVGDDGASVVVQPLATNPFSEHGYASTDSMPVDRRVQIAVGEGVLAAAVWDGNLTILGGTGASIQPVAQINDLYPAPHETVRVNLTESSPGILAPGLEFRANWGDGYVDPWQSGPVFEHTYATKDERQAVFRLRNAAGQTSSHPVLFDVGGSPPVEDPEPNFLETAFRRKNQDLTFGILGIAVALAGGIVALGHRHSKRSRLQRELDAIEQVYEDTKDKPSECEAALMERKAHCRGLLLDGRIEEAQFAVLEKRIEDLHRQLRLTTVDEEFDFLPQRLVRSLHEMLEDCRVGELEKDGFLKALDEDDVLIPSYKKKVRSRIKAWYEKDAGVRG